MMLGALFKVIYKAMALMLLGRIKHDEFIPNLPRDSAI